MGMSTPRTILVSACLLGLNTRYNGEIQANDEVLNLLKRDSWDPIPVCPEQLGGLPTPRPAAEFKTGDGTTLINGQGDLINSLGIDVSREFLRGAEQTVKIARLCNCSVALLKEKSPSCGIHTIYRNGELIKGSGVSAALLLKAGLRVFSDKDIFEGKF